MGRDRKFSPSLQAIFFESSGSPKWVVNIDQVLKGSFLLFASINQGLKGSLLLVANLDQGLKGNVLWVTN